MCVNCLSSVDAVAWNLLGAGTAAAAGWRQVAGRLAPSLASDRRRRTQGDTSLFVAELKGLPDEVVVFWPFVVALVSYVALGLATRSVVLNWIVGPLYLVVALWMVPRGVRRLAGTVRG